MRVPRVCLCAALIALLAGPALARGLPTESTFTNSIGMRFVRLEPGSFLMGNDAPPTSQGGSALHSSRVVGSDPALPQTVESMNGRTFELSRSRGEPRGYLTAIQGANDVIHLISSRNHYAFNLRWLETSPPPE